MVVKRMKIIPKTANAKRGNIFCKITSMSAFSSFDTFSPSACKAPCNDFG